MGLVGWVEQAKPNNRGSGAFIQRTDEQQLHNITHPEPALWTKDLA